ncbi:hypothetical protein Bpfe_021582 [Biomphalaria pfeifferi]|uniref:G-protein coupled receptors family 1 profile domain-containing protein n=1 Tax=Biomphalaria pfeifferi TaxID=112525 RepID=A0AAD8B7J0_BIOPF|nr:hypothetical protein Bpfe_021582 [Biomphalaria pfeifferi]
MERGDNLTSSSSESLALQLTFLNMVHIIGLLLNLACLFVIVRRYKALEQKKRYILLGNLLLCDFILLLWVVPVTVRLLTCSSTDCRMSVLNPVVCRTTAFLFQCSYICGVLTQVFLAVDRTMTTAHPCVSIKYLTGKVYVTTIAFCWLFSALHASIPLAPQYTGVSYLFSDRVKKCNHSYLHSCWYYTYSTILVHGVLTPSILLCYLYMAWRIRQLRSRCDSQQTALLNSVISSTHQRNCSNTDLHTSKFTHDIQSKSRPNISRELERKPTQVKSSKAESVSDLEEMFTEFMRFRQYPRTIVEQGVQTSFVRSTSSGGKDEDVSSRSSPTLPTFQKRHSLDTTLGGLTSKAISDINYIPSKASDLKGFLLTQHVISVTSLDWSIKQSEQLRLKRSCQGSKNLTTATVGSIQHGLFLTVVTYVWSIPYTIATKCPRGEVSISFSVLAMFLCYTSAIFYPLLYFFVHENFIRHFRLAITSL